MREKEVVERAATPQGLVVMEAMIGSDVGTAEHDMLAFKVTKAPGGPGDKHQLFTASIPERSISWMANTAERAIAHMLHGVAMLARDGALDPNEPARKGVPSIQHVLGILTERLAWHVERRREGCEAGVGRR